MKSYTTKLNGKKNKVRIEMTIEELVDELQTARGYGSDDAVKWIAEGWVTTLTIVPVSLVIDSVAPAMKKCEACKDGWDPQFPESSDERKLCSKCGGSEEVIVCDK